MEAAADANVPAWSANPGRARTRYQARARTPDVPAGGGSPGHFPAHPAVPAAAVRAGSADGVRPLAHQPDRRRRGATPDSPAVGANLGRRVGPIADQRVTTPG